MNSQDSWIGVSRALLITSGLLVQRVFGDGASLEPRAGAGKHDRVGCVELAPPGLCGLDDPVAGVGGCRHGQARPHRARRTDRLRARDRTLLAHARMLEDIEPAGVMTTMDVLRRIVANLCGNSDLPCRGCSPPVTGVTLGIGADRADSARRTRACGVICLTRCHNS